jgi:hypothetical protein
LASNWQNWKKTLEETDKTSVDYAKTATEVTAAVKDIVGAGDEFNLSASFIANNMELIGRAANGEAKAIAELGIATAKSTISNLTFNEAFSKLQSMDEENPFEEFTKSFTDN